MVLKFDKYILKYSFFLKKMGKDFPTASKVSLQEDQKLKYRSVKVYVASNQI